MQITNQMPVTQNQVIEDKEDRAKAFFDTSKICRRVVKNTMKVALPALAMFAASQVQSAEAVTPICYAICVPACHAACVVGSATIPGVVEFCATMGVQSCAWACAHTVYIPFC